MKTILLSILIIVIGISLLFFYGVSKVNASQIIRGFCGDTEVFNTNNNGYQNIPTQPNKCITHIIYANTSYNIASAKDVELQFDIDYITRNSMTSVVNYTITGGYIDDTWYYGSSKACTQTSAKSQTATSILAVSGYKRRVYGGVFCNKLQIGGTTKYPAMKITFDTSPDTTNGHTFYGLEGYIQANQIVASPTDNNQSNYNGPTSTQFQNWFNQQINNANNNTNTIINNNNENTDRIIETLEGEDLTTNEKQPATNNDVNNYQDQEDALMDMMDTDSLDNVDIAIEIQSNNWIWQTMTSLMNTHAIIMTMFISLLSIGVIKLVMNR